MTIRRSYPDDISDKEWLVIEELVNEKTSPRGRKPKHTKREMLNAIFYLLRTGCGWRHMPHDLPPWKSVYSQFRRWRIKGVFEKIHTHLRKELRILLGRTQEPTASIIDSQSIKTTEKGGSKGMMVQRKSKVGKGTLLLILKGFY